MYVKVCQEIANAKVRKYFHSSQATLNFDAFISRILSVVSRRFVTVVVLLNRKSGICQWICGSAWGNSIGQIQGLVNLKRSRDMSIVWQYQVYTFRRQACAGTRCAEEVCSRYEYVVRNLLYPLQRCLQVFQFSNAQGPAGNVENLLPAVAKSYMTSVTISTATGTQQCSHYIIFISFMLQIARSAIIALAYDLAK